ncbi:MAG: HAD family phosphatase [Acidiferrobacterales bacterium]|nr:HAD family phosphatase [Acidiferrobacterales bacterium]
MSISGVILDLDGVLIDTESISKMAWMRAANEMGFDIPETLYQKLIGISVLDARKEIASLVNGKIDMDRYMERSAAIYFNEMESNGVRLMPGVPELFEFLRQSELKSAIATSSLEEHAEWKLSKAGLTGMIDDVITGDRTTKGKPAPDLFLIAAAQIAVKPDACAVVEDAHAGILGAKAAGMVPIMVPGTGTSTAASEKIAHAVVSDLYEAIGKLQEII